MSQYEAGQLQPQRPDLNEDGGRDDRDSPQQRHLTRPEVLDNWSKFQRKHKQFDLLIFQSNGRDTYFKRAAQRRGEAEGLWIENPMKNSFMFNVNWDYGDAKVDAKRLSSFQFCNHFPDTRELTTKQGLTKNLNSITLPGANPATFFPRSYDLGDSKQLELFLADFNHTSILNVIQKHAEYFERLLTMSEREKGNGAGQRSWTFENAGLVRECLQMAEKSENAHE